MAPHHFPCKPSYPPISYMSIKDSFPYRSLSPKASCTIFPPLQGLKHSDNSKNLKAQVFPVQLHASPTQAIREVEYARTESNRLRRVYCSKTNTVFKSSHRLALGDLAATSYPCDKVGVVSLLDTSQNNTRIGQFVVRLHPGQELITLPVVDSLISGKVPSLATCPGSRWNGLLGFLLSHLTVKKAEQFDVSVNNTDKGRTPWSADIWTVLRYRSNIFRQACLGEYVPS